MAKVNKQASKPEGLNYHELQDHTKNVLEAAKGELARLDRARIALLDQIQQMEVMLGIRRYPTQKRRGRITSEVLQADIGEILKGARGNQLSAAEILQHLVEERAYPRTRSLRTRVYGALSKWSTTDTFVTRVDRGVYKLLD